MKLEAVETVRVPMPLVRPFRTSFGLQVARDVLLVHVRTDVGEGWGEAAAHAEPYYNEEFVDASQLVIERFLVPAIVARGDFHSSDLSEIFRRVKGYPAAKAGLEMALLDAELRAADERLVDALGGVRSAVAVGVSVGITSSIDELVATVDGYVGDGYQRVKLKIEPGFDIEVLTAVRAAFPDLALQVDANAAYTSSDLELLRRCDHFNLLMIEQPFAVDDLETHAILAASMATPICLDESIVSLAATRRALDAAACSIVNLKVGRLGGVLSAKAVHDFCCERGVATWCGGMLESGIGRATNVALAALPGCVYPGDISASERYFSQDVTEPFILENSTLAVPRGPGLGVTVDLEAIRTLGGISRKVF